VMDRESGEEKDGLR